MQDVVSHALAKLMMAKKKVGSIPEHHFCSLNVSRCEISEQSNSVSHFICFAYVS